MSGGITVKEFKHIPGVNDAEYIKLLKEHDEINKKECKNYATKEDGIEAIRMAISALEGKDTNVPTNSALDHIHNVVAENEWRNYGKRV